MSAPKPNLRKLPGSLFVLILHFTLFLCGVGPGVMYSPLSRSLCAGVKIIFRVGLVLLKSMLGSRDKLKSCPGQYETMEVLRAIEPRYMQEAYLVHQVTHTGDNRETIQTQSTLD